MVDSKSSVSEGPTIVDDPASDAQDGNPASQPLGAERDTADVPDKASQAPKATSTESPPINDKVCVVVSLVRHAECASNVTGNYVGEPDPLTERGRNQAKSLGEAWANVRIDYLLSSDLGRAYETALQISEHNKGHPEVIQTGLITEREWGDTVTEYVRRGHHDQVVTALSGYGPRQYGPPKRDHRPPGGESLNDVARRARLFARIHFLGTPFTVPMPEPPKCLLDKEEAKSPETLPEGVPHFVVVSHNVFLTELYEELVCWNAKEHIMTSIAFKNAAWSRHILWYDRGTKQMEHWDMRSPGESRR